MPKYVPRLEGIMHDPKGLKKTNLKCSDGNFFILLFQIKFYFSNGKLLGIV
jgi:hypothetical protein